MPALPIPITSLRRAFAVGALCVVATATAWTAQTGESNAQIDARWASLEPQMRDLQGQFALRTYRDPWDGRSMAYHIWVPPGYAPDTPCPVVVYLHGNNGNDASDPVWENAAAFALPANQRALPCIVIAPVITKLTRITVSAYNWMAHAHLLEGVLDEVASRYAVDRDRCYLTGFSMGGNGALTVGIGYPDRWAAVASVDGPWGETAELPTDHSAWLVENRVAVATYWSATSGTWPASQPWVDALTALGGEAGAVVYPESDHVESSHGAYTDPTLAPWLARHHRSHDAVVAPAAPWARSDWAYATSVGTATRIRLVGHDPDGDPIGFRVTGGPAHGSLAGTPPLLTYTPEPGFAGIDAITYVASDGERSSDEAVVTVCVGVPYPYLSIASGGDAIEPATAGAFTIAARTPYQQDLPIRYGMVTAGDSAAMPGVDYVAPSGRALIAGGSASTAVAITPIARHLGGSPIVVRMRLFNDWPHPDAPGAIQIIDNGDWQVGPDITAQPVDQRVPVGGTATFVVGATGDGLAFQWYRDGSAVAGGTGAALAVGPVTSADTGARFWCVVTGDGRVVSAEATLTVVEDMVAPSIVTAPQPATVALGAAARFTIAAAGSAPLAYQWQRDGAAIVGATAAEYVTPPCVLADSGAAYACVVSNGAGSATSAAAILRVDDGGLVGWWALDEGVGTTAADSSGHGDDGRVVGPAAWIAGADGAALRLNGSSWVVIDDRPALNPSIAITIVAWVSVTAASNLPQTIVEKGLEEAAQYGLRLQPGGAPRLRIGGATLDAVASVPVGGWHRLVGTSDGAVLTLWLDGERVATRAIAATMEDHGGKLLLGARDFRTAIALTGGVDDVRIYGRCLGEAEIRALGEPRAVVSSPAATRSSTAPSAGRHGCGAGAAVTALGAMACLGLRLLARR